MPNTPNRRPPVRPVRRRRRRKFRPQFLALVYTLLALVILIPLAVHFLGGRKDDAGSGKDSTSSSSVSDSASASDSSASDSSDSVPSEENSDAESGSDAVSEDPAALELAAGKAAIESIAAQMSALETSVPFSASVTAGHPYLAAVNRAANTVTIYEDDGNGNYYKPYCAMICSTGGENTPRGVWNMPTSDESPARPIVRAEWHLLDGNVYGQYISRITPNDGILFHSVPYYTSGQKDSLEYDEFNKLGTTASAGCVRLSVIDAKWVYDNLPTGTMTVIYDDAENPGPLGKPDGIKLDTSDAEKRNWDPTDPDTPYGAVGSNAIFGH